MFITYYTASHTKAEHYLREVHIYTIQHTMTFATQCQPLSMCHFQKVTFYQTKAIIFSYTHFQHQHGYKYLSLEEHTPLANQL